MSNETPQADGEPTQSVPEAPAPEAPAASTPPEEAPTDETTPFTYDDAVKSAGDEDDVEAAPTVAAPAAPVAPAAVAADRPPGIFVPKWVGIAAAAIVAALVFGGIGYAIGDSSGSNSQDAANSFPGAANGNGNRQLPNGQFPNLPNGNGNNGNGNGNGGSGSSQTSGDTAFLGVALQNAANGVTVTEVQSGSPAADAGLKSGDVITSIDGTNVTTAAALASAIQQHSSGDQVTIAYTRGGTSATAKVTLSSRSKAQSS